MTMHVISDLHFDDEWICNDLRQFDTVEQMNQVILSNCKAKISGEDTLLFLGDIVGSEATIQDVWKWHAELNIDHWIRGDHDGVAKSQMDETALPMCSPFSREYKGHTFQFKHKRKPDRDNDCWLVHGHVHNKHPDKYPFIDPESRCINVSASMIQYEPISMDRIVGLVETGKRYKFLP